MRDRGLLWLSLLAFCIAAGLGVTRIFIQYDVPDGRYSAGGMGLFDFHCGVYYPAVAFRHGVNPYGQEILEKGYPLVRPSPIFGPTHFLLHLPLSLLPLRAAEIAYTALNLVMLLSIVAVPALELRSREHGTSPSGKSDRGGTGRGHRSARWWAFVFFAAAAVLVSRPGHITLVSGYFTAELVLATLLTLFWADRSPKLSAIAFLVACGKPTYAIPLLCVLAIRGSWRAAMYGGVLAAVLTAISIGWLLVNHTPASLVEGIREGQMAHMHDPVELPVNTWFRVDWAAIVAKWLERNPSELIQLIVALVLYLILFLLFRQWFRGEADRDRLSPTQPLSPRTDLSDRSAGNGPLTGLAAGILLLSIVLFLYRHVYDCLLLVPPLLALVSGRPGWVQRLGSGTRFAVIFLLATPFWNYSGSETVLNRLPDLDLLQRSLTSVNTLAITAAGGLILWANARRAGASTRVAAP